MDPPLGLGEPRGPSLKRKNMNAWRLIRGVRKMEYFILASYGTSFDETLNSIDALVKEKMKQGFKPQGGICIAATVETIQDLRKGGEYNSDSYYAAQAMVKEE